jgi:phosphohistidine phosphatase
MSDERLVYLIRHGIAGERGPLYPDDSKRPLTSDGKARMKEIAAGLVALGVDVDAVFTSPFVRTRQTADLVAAAWSKPPRVVDLDALAVDGRPADVIAAVASADVRQAALVGHMPGIGQLAADLLGTSRPLEFKKGAVALLGFTGVPGRGRGSLLWFATPRMLRCLGKRT